MKLGLGTVQFGLDYGISNSRGRISGEAAGDILVAARALGVDIIDTATSYGQSEEALGAALPPDHDFAIVTKTPVFGSGEIGQRQTDELKQSLERSLFRLHSECLCGLLLHHGGDLENPGAERLVRALEDLKRAGLVAKIGVSVHHPGELDTALRYFVPDIVQLPLNAFDQRTVTNGSLARLRQAGIEVHARSVFLQGLLLMAPQTLPVHLEAARAPLQRFRALARENGLTPLAAALQFVRRQETVEAVIVGVTSLAELEEIAAAFAAPDAGLDFSSLAVEDGAVIDPLKWLEAS